MAWQMAHAFQQDYVFVQLGDPKAGPEVSVCIGVANVG